MLYLLYAEEQTEQREKSATLGPTTQKNSPESVFITFIVKEKKKCLKVHIFTEKCLLNDLFKHSLVERRIFV